MTDLSQLSFPALWRVLPQDADPRETREWLDAFDAVVEAEGRERATFLLRKLLDHARSRRVPLPPVLHTPYANTIRLAEQPQYPGNLDIESRILAIVRWNALAMVVRANRQHAELGGHIATYASIAELFEVGFNHFFRAPHGDRAGARGGDLVYFQPHASPGVYARAFLEGRLSEVELENYRRETGGRGLSSYCHPYLMPDFWQFPNASMGIGPITAIYQARFMRYLEHRGILETTGRKVWAFVGDGEMDEPESLAGLSVAAREGLDNLIFVVNCNLQRLDGPVRGNGSVIQELEGLFAGAGWNVIKVLWGSDWDPLFARDEENVILKRLHETVDGEFQKYAATDGRFNREHFFNKYPELQALVAHLSDEDIDRLRRGGHDPIKIYAAYHAAVHHIGQPTVILAQTKKGYGMGHWAQGRMGAHQAKKLEHDALLAFRDRFALPISDDDVHHLRFYQPSPDSPEMRYVKARRGELGGPVPVRSQQARALAVPALESFARLLEGSAGREESTTMVFVRALSQLLRDPGLGRHIVPIVADEARTFGMQSLFRQVAIYSPFGQLYEPEDRDELLYYKETKDGQIIEEGITEAGAMSSWIAAATSYSTHGVPMLPFYIFYSMFGFQRVGDFMWAAADSRARGFLIGATAGRTTLSGEGLQHQDGTSRPAPGGGGGGAPPPPPRRVQLLGSGTILREVLAAAEILESQFDVAADVWSVTSFTELARDGMQAERWSRLHPTAPARETWVETCLKDRAGPAIAATDYVRAYAEQIRGLVKRPYTVLGTDGIGRSDTRPALRAFFEVDRRHIALAALKALAEGEALPATAVAEAMARLGIDSERGEPWRL